MRLTLSAEPPPPPRSEGPEASPQAAAAEAGPAYFEEYDIRADGGGAAATAAPGVPNLLLVAVVRARGLLAMDTNLFGGEKKRPCPLCNLIFTSSSILTYRMFVCTVFFFVSPQTRPPPP